MSYSDTDGQVVLTMSREDYARVMEFLVFAAGLTSQPTVGVLQFLNRLNEGNPNYTPYQVKP